MAARAAAATGLDTLEAGKNRYREFMKLGVPPGMAGLGAVGTSPRRMAASPELQMALSNAYWRKQGLLSLAERYRQLRRTWRTAGCGPARPVV